MSYMDNVMKKVSSAQRVKTKNRLVEQNNKSSSETQKINTLRDKFAGQKIDEHPRYVDPPLSRQPINADANKRKGFHDTVLSNGKPVSGSNTRKQRNRLSQIRTAVRAGTEGPSASVKNTNKKSPRYGQYYSIEAGKGGNYHVYKGGKKVFVRSRTGLSINKRKSTNAKKFNPKKGLHNKEYLIDA